MARPRATRSPARVHILDPSRIPAGPTRIRLLGDLGAEAIKVGQPGVRVDTHGWKPPFIANVSGESADASSFRRAGAVS